LDALLFYITGLHSAISHPIQSNQLSQTNLFRADELVMPGRLMVHEVMKDYVH